ncbi:heat shock transcription factor, Y-linked-like [Rhinolophus sinicus]|uniref:heat shock transcription factor, Y-linked-like n=1 Tax=Rhinolophus sinicus TaxID=89399 RepID=UPI003D79F51D
MTHVSSGNQSVSTKGGSAASENSIVSLMREHSFTENMDLRAVIEEKAFLCLSEGSLIRKPYYKYCDSEPEEENDFCFMNFPRKLWKIVESKHFKSIWWDENGTSIVIDEDLFKKEVLERKAPFKIFETGSMTSLIRQLNLYGFRKLGQTLQRSASLHDFLEEEKAVSVFSKLHSYQNPNFQQGCPHLLLRMKRRIGMRNASQSFASVQDFNNKHFKAKYYVNNHNSSFLADRKPKKHSKPLYEIQAPPRFQGESCKTALASQGWAPVTLSPASMLIHWLRFQLTGL